MSDNTQNKLKLTVFLDSVGRTVLGEEVETTDETKVAVKNPVILHVVPDNQGRMSVQLLPLFFREFMADKEEDTVFSFNKAQIAETNLTNLDFRLQAQYSQLFGKNNLFVPPPPQEEEKKSDRIVNLFDE